MATKEAVRKLLERRGWVFVPAANINHLINHGKRGLAAMAVMELGLKPRLSGWIKPPQMKLYSTEEAYNKEGFVYADL